MRLKAVVPLLARDCTVGARDAIAQIGIVIQFNLLCLRIHHSSKTVKASACVGVQMNDASDHRSPS